MDSSYKKYYIIVPDEIARSVHTGGDEKKKRERLSCCHRDLLGKIVSLSQHGPCTSGNDYFAEYIGVKKRQIMNLLEDLENDGFIERKGRGDNRKIFPTEKSLKIWRRCSSSPSAIDCTSKGGDNSPSAIDCTTKCNTVHLPSAIDCTHNNKENKKKNRERLSLLPIPSLEEVAAEIEKEGYSVNADDFWNYYQKLGWQDSNGKPVRNWKAKLATWNLHSGGKQNTQTAAPVSLSVEEVKKQEEQRKAEEAEHKAKLQAFYEARNKEVRRGQTQ